MSGKRTSLSRYETHQEAWEVLPWYVNGTLEEAELERVGEHVAGCVACRSEVKYLQALAGLIQSDDVHLPARTLGFSEVMRRIERADRGEDPKGGSEPATSLLRPLARWLGRPRVLRRLLAAQAALIAILLALIVGQDRSAPPEPFRTLSDVVVQDDDSRTRLRLVFAEGVSERQIRELVRFVGGEIVGGPSDMGVYTLRLRSSALEGEELRALLEEIRSSPQVQFAELTSEGGP